MARIDAFLGHIFVDPEKKLCGAPVEEKALVPGTATLGTDSDNRYEPERVI